MNITTEGKFLIDRYIDEVKGRLPQKSRVDIGDEIRSAILDMLDDQATASEGEVNETMVREALKTFGPPGKIAASYASGSYLIGPRMMPAFTLTLKITLIAAIVGVAVGFVASFPKDPLDALFGLVPGAAFAALQAFGTIALIFAILERTLPDPDWGTELRSWEIFAKTPVLRAILAPKIWDPMSLKSINGTKRVDRIGEIISLVFTFLAIVLFNFYPMWLGVFNFTDSGYTFTPILGQAYQIYLPWWNLYWVLLILFSIVLLSQRYWSSALHWMNFGLRIMGITILIEMIQGPSLVGSNPEFLAYHAARGTQIADASGWLPELTSAVTLALVLMLAMRLLVILKALLEVVRAQPWLDKESTAPVN